MLKKSVVTFIVIVLFASTGVLAEANAVSISNGSACVKAGVSTTVKVKGASKLYVPEIPPRPASRP